MAAKLMTIPLCNLRRSEANGRKTDPTRDLDELAASIAAHGLIQNLTIRAVGANGKKRTAVYEVVAGGRRLAALKLLAKRKRIATDFPVPCHVVARDDAEEVSLAENVVRTALHPADQFDAFARLHGQGFGIEDIAARFGISSRIVEQRLKLACVSPKIMDVYRAGDMTLDQLMAFTLTDDHEAQERVWFDGATYDRHPQTLKRMLTRTLVEGSDRRARFVGAEAYEGAGGTIVRDLFRSDDEAYFADSGLLDRLVAEKLEAEADKAKAEGWSWVEIMTEIDHGYVARFRQLFPTEVTLSKKEEARLAKCCNRHDELIADLDDDAPAEVVAQLDRLAAEIQMLSEKKQRWTDEDKARAGVVIGLDYEGQLSIIRGLSREERPAATPKPKAEPKADGDAGDTRERSNGSVPDRLIEDLTAHRTAALRAVLAGAPSLALRALAHTLILQTFFGAVEEGCVGVRASFVDLKPSADGIGESRAAVELAERHRTLLARLPEPEKLWDWLDNQSDEVVLELVAYGVATTVNAVRRKGDGHRWARFDQADMLAKATGLDMAEWWEPHGDRYLNRVSKALILAAVAEGVSPQAADNIRALKRDAMAVRASELLAGKRWLPESLRPVSPPLAETA